MLVQVKQPSHLSRDLIKYRAFKRWINKEFLPFYTEQKDYFICWSLEGYVKDIKGKKLLGALNKKQYQTKRNYAALLKEFIDKTSGSEATLSPYFCHSYSMSPGLVLVSGQQLRIDWMKSLSFVDFLLLQRKE